jgi:hypothetical protein
MHYAVYSKAHRSLGKGYKAIEYHEQHLTMAKEVGDRAGEGMAYRTLDVQPRVLPKSRWSSDRARARALVCVPQPPKTKPPRRAQIAPQARHGVPHLTLVLIRTGHPHVMRYRSRHWGGLVCSWEGFSHENWR